MGALALLLSSCLKDNSNYDIVPHEEISIEGIDPSYTVISGMDRLTFDPDVASSSDSDDFEYLWGIYETNVQGYAPVLDTLAKTKELDYLVAQAAKAWVLVFRVTNKQTGYSRYVNSTINVVTPYTRGWYVAKGDGDSTDVDLFLTPNSIVPESIIPNVFSNINGHKLAGNPLIMNFYTDYKSTETGILGNTRTLFVLSDKDAAAVSINTFRVLRGFNQLFYKDPEVRSPGFVSNGSQANYFMNDGGVHSIYAMSANTGQFGVRKMKDASNTPYYLSRFFLTAWLGDPFFFDLISSSFLSATGSGSVMTAVSDASNTEMPANNNNKELLFMGLKSSAVVSVNGFAMFQDKTDPSLKILSSVSPSRAAFRMVNDTLQSSEKLYHADRYALLDGDENLLYFSMGNEVWSRNLSNRFEQLQYTVPAGEEVTFMRHRKYSSEAAYAFNYVMIGTKSGENYKVRMFTKSSGNLATEPSVVLEGNGAVGDVMYISPSVSGTTYNNTY